MDEKHARIHVLWENAECLDLRGLKCPMPTLMTERALRRLSPGTWIAVTVTDPMAPLDLQHLCQRDGHELVDQELNEKGALRILIRCGPLKNSG